MWIDVVIFSFVVDVRPPYDLPLLVSPWEPLDLYKISLYTYIYISESTRRVDNHVKRDTHEESYLLVFWHELS